MTKRIEYIPGQIINNLTFIRDIKQNTEYRKDRRALFECYCGNEFISIISHVKSGHTKSCGCLFRKVVKVCNKTHGDTHKSYIHNTWVCIKGRCFNQSNPAYDSYGGRGITIYKYWIRDYISFKNYILSELGERPTKDHSLDRIDNNGNYEPGNLRWGSRSTQTINQRVRVDNTSGYKGISKAKNGKWVSSISYKNEKYHLGYFENKIDAVKARDRHIIKNNFPHKTQLT